MKYHKKNWDKTQKATKIIKKAKIVTKLKNSNLDKTKIIRKLKNSNCD